jgi:pyruvate dehydrogenase kinase 2/3/4
MFKGPPVQLICPQNLNFAYVPGHLSHICFELLKNSLRAVVERHGHDSEHFPPIKVIVVEGKEDITIKISDEGGGIPRSAIPLIWTYMYTTMDIASIDTDFSDSDFKAPMAGFGYGLPLSRLVRFRLRCIWHMVNISRSTPVILEAIYVSYLWMDSELTFTFI